MARPSNTSERRRQIARALMKVMASKGYDGASVGRIARTAKLTPGLVHYHFKSKKEALLEVLRTLVEEHDTGLKNRLEQSPGGPLRKVDDFIDFHLGLGADANPEALACWVLLGGESLRQATIRGEYEKAILSFRKTLVGLIQLGNDEGLFDCPDAEAAASALVALIQGYFALAATSRSAIPRGSAARSAKAMARSLLGAKEG